MLLATLIRWETLTCVHARPAQLKAILKSRVYWRVSYQHQAKMTLKNCDVEKNVAFLIKLASYTLIYKEFWTLLLITNRTRSADSSKSVPPG